jgi:thioredoxin reductase
LPIQVAGQSAGTGQSAAGLSAALQAHPSNASLPVFVWSPSLGGSLAQWNAAASSGNAYNGALGVQEVEQAA